MIKIIRLKDLLVSIIFRPIHIRLICVRDFLIICLFYSKQAYLKMWRMNQFLIQERWRVGSSFSLRFSYPLLKCRCTFESCYWISTYSYRINASACCCPSVSLASGPLYGRNTSIDWLQWIFRYSFTKKSITSSVEFTGTMWDAFGLFSKI